MPPDPTTLAGPDVVIESWVDGGFGSPLLGAFRCVATRANRMPAVACYLCRPGESEYRPLALDVLQIENGMVAEVTTFALEPMRKALGLPATLS